MEENGRCTVDLQQSVFWPYLDSKGAYRLETRKRPQLLSLLLEQSFISSQRKYLCSKMRRPITFCFSDLSQWVMILCGSIHSELNL